MSTSGRDELMAELNKLSTANKIKFTRELLESTSRSYLDKLSDEERNTEEVTLMFYFKVATATNEQLRSALLAVGEL